MKPRLQRLLDRFEANNRSVLSAVARHMEMWSESIEKAPGVYPEAETARIAVGVEYSYPYLALYDYEQFLGTFLLAAWLERTAGQKLGVVLVGSDSSEVNRYNVNPVFREYFLRRKMLAWVVADLVVESGLAEDLNVPAEATYLHRIDASLLRQHVDALQAKATRYVSFIRGLKLAALGRLFPFDAIHLSEAVVFQDVPIETFRQRARSELGGLLEGLRSRSLAEDRVTPIQAYRMSTGKSVSVGSTLRDDPFIAYCPRCHAGSARIVEGHYRPSEQTIRYRCCGRERLLYPNFLTNEADSASGCGLTYSLNTGEADYYLRESGDIVGYPRFALASVVTKWPIWVMESTEVISTGLLGSMMRLRESYHRGALGHRPAAAPPLLLLCCAGPRKERPLDLSTHAFDQDDLQELQDNLRLSVFTGSEHNLEEQ